MSARIHGGELAVVLQADERAVRLLLTDAGVGDVEIVNGRGTPSDLTLRRSLEAHLGDATMRWAVHDLAAHTTLAVGAAPHLGPWGFPIAAVVERTADAAMVLRFHCARSPFGGRPLSFDLVTEGSTLRTRAAGGSADLEVHTDWSAVARWLATPELLFADTVAAPTALRGEIALISMFEGLVWEVMSQQPSVAEVVLRWGRLWASDPVRRDLERLGSLLTIPGAPPPTR